MKSGARNAKLIEVTDVITTNTVDGKHYRRSMVSGKKWVGAKSVFNLDPLVMGECRRRVWGSAGSSLSEVWGKAP